MDPKTGTARPGGRTARTRHSVHEAVRALLAEHDSADVQVAEVAALAGVHPATIYRRWGSAAALVLEVAVAELEQTSPVQVTGDLRQDLSRYARALAESTSRPGGLAFLRAIVAASNDPATGAEGASRILAGRLAQFRALLDAAPTPARLSSIDVVDGLLAPIYLRALLSQPTSLSPRDLDRLVDNLVLIAEHRGSGGAGRDARPAPRR